MIDQETGLRELLAKGSNASLLREMIGFAAQRLMELEAGQRCGAAHGERSETRRVQRNGYRERDWETRAGTVELRIPTMQRLGLYISEPRSAQETDHRFPEPALLVVNPEGVLQIVDVANAPFVRPDLDTLLQGLSFVIEKNYPVRGTHR